MSEHAVQIGAREPHWTWHDVGNLRADHGPKHEPGRIKDAQRADASNLSRKNSCASLSASARASDWRALDDVRDFELDGQSPITEATFGSGSGATRGTGPPSGCGSCGFGCRSGLLQKPAATLFAEALHREGLSERGASAGILLSGNVAMAKVRGSTDWKVKEFGPENLRPPAPTTR